MMPHGAVVFVRVGMQTVTVPATAAFSHQGESYLPGDAVTVAPVEAAALARQGFVSLEGGYQTRAVEAEVAPVRRGRGRPKRDPNAPKRAYRRRDLTAEP